MKRLAVAFTGPSNSGKTTLIVKLSNILQDKGFKVAIIKHDPKDKAIFDREGKDSYKFSQTGAEVAVLSPNRTTIFKKETVTLEHLIELFDNFDYLLVEGLKTLKLPRISINRNKLDSEYFSMSDTLAIDDTINIQDIPKDMNYLNLNDSDEIINWINKNAKKI